MSVVADEAAVARAAAGRTLRLPRVRHRGRVGDVRAASAGSALEVHDFRQYQPGDDPRQLDWNAVARTGELVVRVRQEEVAPRVEVLLDASRSMALTEAKERRAREVALWVLALAHQGGYAATAFSLGAQGQRAAGAVGRVLVAEAAFDGPDAFTAALRRVPPLSPSGLRVVVSDFLFEGRPEALVERLARDAAGLALVQLLDVEDVEPSAGLGARLVDSETGEALERVLSASVLHGYQRRLGAHLDAWRAAATRAGASWLSCVCARPLEALAMHELLPLVALD